jgi:nucleoside-diphosphate-sugar epimerase
MHNILVTGAAGAIGHHLIKRLSQRDCKVIIIDNLSNADSDFLNRVKAALLTSHMSRSNFVRLNGIGNVSIYIEDIRNKESIIDIFKKEDIDTCIHLAAKEGVQESIRNPEDTIDVNIKGTFNVLEACSSVSVENFIFASSSAVYGQSNNVPISEEQQLNPMSPYGAGKIAGEALVSSFKNTGKIQNAISLRIFNVFGEGVRSSAKNKGVISQFAERLSANMFPIISGDGGQVRDFISINSVVEAILTAVDFKGTAVPDVHAINVGTGKATTMLELANMMIRIFGLNCQPDITEPRPGDIRYSCANTDKMRSFLNLVPDDELEPYLKNLASKVYQEGKCSN